MDMDTVLTGRQTLNGQIHKTCLVIHLYKARKPGFSGGCLGSGIRAITVKDTHGGTGMALAIRYTLTAYNHGTPGIF
jgi:hypothetical protein